MHIATLKNSEACIEYLLNNDVPVNIEDAIGNIALHIAAIQKNYYIAELLCENGADVNKKNKLNISPLDIVESYWFNSLKYLLRKYK